MAVFSPAWNIENVVAVVATAAATAAVDAAALSFAAVFECKPSKWKNDEAESIGKRRKISWQIDWVLRVWNIQTTFEMNCILFDYD